MPTFSFTAPDGKSYDIEAPEGATQEQAFSMLQQHLGQAPEQAPEQVPQVQQQAREPSFGEKLLGLGEAALTTATGATGGALGMLGGTLGGIAGSISSGTYGTAAGVRGVEEEAMRGAEKLTYQPRTEAGKEYAGAIGEAAQQLAPLSAVSPEMAAVGQLAKPAAAVMRPLPKPSVMAEAAPSAAQEASKLGIKVLTSDIRQPRTFVGKAAQVAGERIPVVGTGVMREAQQAQRVEAVKNTLQDFGWHEAAKASEDVMKDLAKTRANELTKYADLKKGVINKLDEAGTVPVNNTLEKIDSEIARLQAVSPEGYAPVIKQLEQFKTDVQGKTLTNIEGNRKLLGESFKAPELAAVRGEGEKAVSNIYGALKQDMSEFIKTNGERRDLVKWNVANNRLSQMAGELKNTALKSTLKRGDATPEVVNNMLFSAKPSEIKALNANLSPQGRANARVAILDDAINKAGGIEQFSPDVFKNQLQKRQNSVGVFFSGDDKARIDGLMKALELTKRAGEYAAHPPTGAQLYAPVGAAVLTDLFGGMGAGLISGAAIGGMARMYESGIVGNTLKQLGKVAKGSQKEAELYQRLVDTAQMSQKKNLVPYTLGAQQSSSGQPNPEVTVKGKDQFSTPIGARG